jgi:putative ABC transport system permease protein
VASVAGVALAVGLFSGIAFFVDSSASQMTRRAIAPVTIDLQAGITRPLAAPISIVESVTPVPPLSAAQQVDVSLVVSNNGSLPATSVVISEVLPDQLRYVPGSTVAAGTAVTDLSGAGAATGPLAAGINVGNLGPGGRVTVTFRATAAGPIALGGLLPAATVRSAEYPVASGAGDAPAVDVTSLAQQIQGVPGVVAVQPFALVDLPAGTVTAGAAAMNDTIKIVAVDPAYLTTFPVIRLTDGVYQPGSALLSQAAADLLSVTPGQHVLLHVPGSTAPVDFAVSGIADLSSPATDPLFTSRNAANAGEVAAAPYVLVVDLHAFQTSIMPALRADAAATSQSAGTTASVLQPPVVEVHVAVSHDMLANDPAAALINTRGLRRSIERLEPGGIKALDNLSDSLTLVQGDATLAKVLFLFLGLPGVLLGAYLSRYASGLLAEAQRRDRALLRARGFSPDLLLRALTYNAVAVTALGAIVGLALGLVALALVFGGLRTLAVSPEGSALTIGLSVLVAILTTTLGLYLPARLAMGREVAEERREVQAARAPFWMRIKLDFVLLVIAAVVGAITILAGGYKPSGAEGQTVSLSFYVLVAPLCFWIGAPLLAVRMFLFAVGHWRGRRRVGGRPSGVLRTTLVIGLRRRPLAAASGVIALTLAVAFGTSLAIFAQTFETAKLSDARFVTGGDIRVVPVPSTIGAVTGSPDLTSTLQVPGVVAMTVLARGSAVVGADRRTVAAIDPATFGRVAALNPSFFGGSAPQQLLDALASDPDGALISLDMSRTFDIVVGDEIRIQMLDRIRPKAVPGKAVTPILVPRTLHALGVFTSFPGFPQGVDLVINLAPYAATVHAPGPDIYMLKTNASDEGTAAVAAAIAANAPRDRHVVIDTVAKAYGVNQSSLSAINVSGLGRLESLYTTLMSALGIAIFVFGVLLQRAKEHVTLRALGIRLSQLRAIVLGEAALVAVLSLIVGGLVGTAMASMFVLILGPLFVIPPQTISLPIEELALLNGLVLVATLVASGLAVTTLGRGQLVGILREV